MMNIALKVFWANSPMPINQKIEQPEIVLNIPFGNVLLVNSGGTGDAPVRSVNSKIGHVVLKAIDVSADPVGSADLVKTHLTSKIEAIKLLAETNQLNITNKVDVQDFEINKEQIELNRLALLSKADLTALAMLTTLINTKADQQYVQEQIANILNSDQSIIAAIQEISNALAENDDLLEALDYTVANRVRFDIATQALSALQKNNARVNIGAEEQGTAAMLIAQITAQSIGAASAAQGIKAITALQSADVAPVALTGLFSSLGGQNKIFDVVYSAYAAGSNTAINASDTLGTMLAKLQAQISSSSSVVWVAASTIAVTDGTGRVDISEIQFAKINGLLWIRGKLNVPIEFNGSGAQGNVAMTLTDKNYKLKISNSTLPNGATNNIYVSSFRLTSITVAKTLFFVVKGNAISDATALNSLQTIVVNASTTDRLDQTNLGYELMPTCLGTLLFP